MTCPRRWIKDNPGRSGETFWSYSRYDKGQLPEDGGLLSQPNVWLEIMKVMGAAFGKVEEEDRKKRNRSSATTPPTVAGKGNPYRPKLKPSRSARRR